MDRDAFKVLRKQYHLTQEQMGKALGYSRFAINAWEKGHVSIPADIVQQLAKANLVAPAQKASALKLVEPTTAPQCYRPDLIKGRFVRTLAHPKWWAGMRSPFYKLCSEAEWDAIDGKATMLDLDTYIPPTPQQAFDLMLARGITSMDANKYLATMGSPLPGYVEHARLTDDLDNFPQAEWK